MPVLVVALLEETPNGDLIAAAVFALAAVTDGLDGYIARSRESITNFGKVMDPIADKLLIAASDSDAGWVQAIVYAAVAITVVSGADYFVNVRKRIDGADQAGTRSTS